MYDGETKALKVGDSKIIYTDYEEGMPLKMERTIEKVGRGIDLTIKLQTMMEYPVEIGNIEIPFGTSNFPSYQTPVINTIINQMLVLIKLKGNSYVQN